jgi:GETHR pentapeptide repeat (5 copies)
LAVKLFFQHFIQSVKSERENEIHKGTKTKRGKTKRGKTKRGKTKRGKTKRGKTKRGKTKRHPKGQRQRYIHREKERDALR